MSLIRGNASAAAPTGAIQLFSADQTPEGYERLSSLTLPPDIYARSQRVMLLDHSLPVAAHNYHWFNDPTSTEHVYAATGTSVYRLHLPTGQSEQLPAAPRDLGSGGQFVSGVCTRDGAAFYSVTSASTSTISTSYAFNAQTRAWTSISGTRSGMSLTLAYDESTHTVYQFGGYKYASAGNTQSYSVYAHDLTSNVITELTDDSGAPVVAPAALNAGSAVVLRSYVLIACSGLRVFDLTTKTFRSLGLPSGTTTSSAMYVARLSDTVALLSIAGTFHTVSLSDEGGWALAPADIAGVGTGTWKLGTRGAAGLHGPTGGGVLLFNAPTTSSDGTTLGLCIAAGLDTAPNARVFYARKK